MIRRTVRAGELEPLTIHAAVRQGIAMPEAGTTIGRIALALEDAPLLDAPNPHGFAAGAVEHVIHHLYTPTNVQN